MVQISRPMQDEDGKCALKPGSICRYLASVGISRPFYFHNGNSHPEWRSRYSDGALGPDSIKWWHLTSIGNPIVEIRRSYDRLISTMGFAILVRRHLYIESGPWFPGLTRLCDTSVLCWCSAPSFVRAPDWGVHASFMSKFNQNVHYWASIHRSLNKVVFSLQKTFWINLPQIIFFFYWQ